VVVCYIVTSFWERTKWLWNLVFSCVVIFVIFVFSSDVLARVVSVM
jgi:hypothetical protein